MNGVSAGPSAEKEATRAQRVADLIGLPHTNPLVATALRSERATSNADRVYVESTPTNCTIGGERGQVTAVVRGLAPRRTPRQVFVHLDTGEMLHVLLGEASGERGQWREVRSSHRIDRDGFDRLNEIDTLRTEMGWREPRIRPGEPT